MLLISAGVEVCTEVRRDLFYLGELGQASRRSSADTARRNTHSLAPGMANSFTNEAMLCGLGAMA